VTQQFIDKFQHVAITRIYRQLHGLRDFYCSFKENSQNFSPKEIESKRKRLLELIPICQLFEVDPTKTLNIACEFYGISQEDFVLIQ
jgi:hypothetical protein